jgi:hypothetical protein
MDVNFFVNFIPAMPNLAGHSLQADAKYELETFAPLIQSGCANELQVDFISSYAYNERIVSKSLGVLSK